MNRCRAIAVLIGYNLPLLLFMGYALWVASGGARIGGGCLVRPVLGWCPGCGLTSDFASLLSGELPGSVWFWLIMIGFLLNTIWSIGAARKAGAITPERVALPEHSV